MNQQAKLVRMEDARLDPPDEGKVMYKCDHCAAEIYKGDVYVQLGGDIFCHPDVESCMQDWLMEHEIAQVLTAGEA